MEWQDQLLQYIVSGLTTGAIYALLAVGFVAIYNVTGVINFAQGETAMLGALLMVSLRTEVKLPLPLAFVATIVAVTALGALVHRLALRPARSASPITLIIITIGASIALRGGALVVWGTDSYALPAFTRTRPIHLGSAVLPAQGVWVFACTLAAVLGLYLFFQHTTWGRAVRACGVNRLAARLMGINLDQVSTLSFALGAALGAVAGAVIAPITYATYDMGAMLGLKGFVAAIMGGLSSFPGAVAGGFLLGVLETTGAGLISSGTKNAIAFAVLLVILFLRPGGLLGARQDTQGGL
jgi:branched-chain amino acid transport system permease protein